MPGPAQVFSEVFPIKDFADKAEIDYVKYELEEPKYDTEECQQRGMTYAAPLARHAASVGIRC
jgi:DNA-directed RNA polymerase subunit beta